MNHEKTKFTVRIAGLPIGLCVNYPSSRMFCSAYLAGQDEKEALHVDVTEQDILSEIRRSNPSADESALPCQGAYYETLAMFRKITEAVIGYRTLLIHGSAIALDGEVYLFIAPSGTGKSTHTALWRKCFGNRATMVNDDKPLVRIEEDSVFACGTPWNGKHRLGSNMLAPLKAICYLERAEENSIERLSPEKAFAYVYRQTYRPQDSALLVQTMDLLSRLLRMVPVYRMQMNNFREDAVTIAYEGMNER